jgi:hypothetical protein
MSNRVFPCSLCRLEYVAVQVTIELINRCLTFLPYNDDGDVGAIQSLRFYL